MGEIFVQEQHYYYYIIKVVLCVRRLYPLWWLGRDLSCLVGFLPRDQSLTQSIENCGEGNLEILLL